MEYKDTRYGVIATALINGVDKDHMYPISSLVEMVVKQLGYHPEWLTATLVGRTIGRRWNLTDRGRRRTGRAWRLTPAMMEEVKQRLIKEHGFEM